MSAPRKVLVTTRLFDAAAGEYLAEHGCVVVPSGLPGDALDADIPDATLSALLEGVEGWIVGMRAVTREILAAHPNLKVIARAGKVWGVFTTRQYGYPARDGAAVRFVRH